MPTALPTVVNTITDPGLPKAAILPSRVLVLGTAQSGTVDTLYTVGSISDLVTTFGQGPLSEAAAFIMAKAGGPIDCMRLTGSVAGAAGAVTPTRVGTSTGTITVAGAAYDAYQVIVTITTTGTVATGEFKYSLDNGRSYSSVLTIPGGGTYAIANTNLTLTFVPGGGATYFEAGDYHTFTCTAPSYSTANLASAVTALLALNAKWPFLVLAGRHATGATAATMFGGLDTQMSNFFNSQRYMRAIMDGGNEAAATVKTAFASSFSTRIMVTYGTARRTTAKPIVGWSEPTMSLLVPVAAMAARVKLSTALNRVNNGPLDTVTAISHDERSNEVMDAYGFTTARTHINLGGYYITRGRLKCAVGSDYDMWQLGRIMDTACEVVAQRHATMIGRSVRANKNGSIREEDAAVIESDINNALSNALMAVNNEEGTAGHCSAVSYTINRSYDVLTNRQLLATVSVRPLAYLDTLSTSLGFEVEIAPS